MTSRSNIVALLALITGEASGVDASAKSLRELDGLVRNIEGDVERLRGELDLLLGDGGEGEPELPFPPREPPR